jgi:hypothetical protein
MDAIKELQTEKAVSVLESHNPMEDFKGPTALRMNPRVIETWINNTLTDAESLDIPG